MKANRVLAVFTVAAQLCLSGAALAQGQEQAPDVMWAPGSGAQDTGTPQQRGPRGDQERRGRPVFGKISAIQSDSIEITGSDGNTLTLKLTSNTEFRRDRQPAKLADFKVGDPVVVRTDPADGKGMTAVLVASGQFGTRGGPGGSSPGGGMFGTLGKDFVMGEVKAIDPPRLTVMRTNNVSQTLELNEETSLRRGRESITMAEIQAGDHVIARGALANNVFVPKSLNVVSPEQWKRMQEMLAGSEPDLTGAPNAPAAASSPKNSPESHH
jgi:hypothetical protein